MQVLIDSLVAPGLPITDSRAHIHGITEEQLQQQEAQQQQAEMQQKKEYWTNHVAKA